MSEEPKVRIFWVPQIRDPEAPTADELAAGVPLGEVVDDGLQVAKDDAPAIPLLPRTEHYQLFRRPDRTWDAIPEPDWIVIRPAPDLPPGTLPAGLDGWWLNRRGWAADGTIVHQSGFVGHYAPTGRFEERDGVVAEVFEVRP